MNTPSRIAIAIAALIALSACGETETPLPAAESSIPKVSNPPTKEADIDLPPTASVPATKADSDLPPPAAISVEVGGICSIGVIGGLKVAALDGPVQVESNTSVSGWRSYEAEDGTEAPAWLRVLGQDGAVVFQTPLPATADRPDVAEAVNRASALRSGFENVEVVGLPQGSYTLEVVLNGGSQWVRCRRTYQIEVM